MTTPSTRSAEPLISPRLGARILAEPWLWRRLLPERRAFSPYLVLDYAAVLELHDGQGRRASFHRRQRVRFLQDGVRAILDHLWGDGVALTSYTHSAGPLVETLRDGERRHLVIALPRPMRWGEELSFQVERLAMAGFTTGEEWVTTQIDHPVQRLARTVVFPHERPCQHAVLESPDLGGRPVGLPVQQRQDGRTHVQFDISRPRADVPYTVRWWW